MFVLWLGLFTVSAQDTIKTNSPFPPAPPLPPAPIDYFRRLLAMPMHEREETLAKKAPEQRIVLLAKLKEYEAMPVEQRDLRLGVTELRWYLAPLMRLAPSNRVESLAAVPEEKRSLLEDRLQRWDKLSSEQQKEFLENETTMHYFLQLQTGPPWQQTNMMHLYPPGLREKMEKDLAAWRALPAKKRDRMAKHFQEFFDLNPKDKEKTLDALSDIERAQLEKTLQTFQNLPSNERLRCIESFRKFSRLSAEERNRFVSNARTWQSMSSSDRDNWRELVNQLPQMPPLPPGLKFVPPAPPGFPPVTNLKR